jgi:hypothetical protein
MAARANSIPALAPNTPIFDIALATTFVLVADDRLYEIVVGTLLGDVPRFLRRPTATEYVTLDRPGLIKAIMNFRIVPGQPDCHACRPTPRVFAKGTRAHRLLGAYWRLIYAGSALLRIIWLLATIEKAASRR